MYGILTMVTLYGTFSLVSGAPGRSPLLSETLCCALRSARLAHRLTVTGATARGMASQPGSLLLPPGSAAALGALGLPARLFAARRRSPRGDALNDLHSHSRATGRITT
jgi:hypothetical protein